MSETKIVTGDAYDLDMLENESIDLVVTSPPYYAFREYSDSKQRFNGLGNEPHPYQFINNLGNWMDEVRRVLVNEGNVFVVIGDKSSGSGGHNNKDIGAPKERGPGRYSQSQEIIEGVIAEKKSRMALPWLFALECIKRGWVLRADIIWAKPNSIPTNAKDRVEITHEYIFHFSHQQKHYSTPDRARENSIWQITASEGLRYPKDIFDKLNTDKHFAAFPAELVRRIISGWCPPDGWVLDPFGGSGTTALVAKILGRNVISVDKSAGYSRLARWRIASSNHREKLEKKWSADSTL